MASEIDAWFAGRLPDEWFETVDVRTDSDEIIVIGTLASPPATDLNEDQMRVAEQSRIEGFREDTRSQRMKIAREAQAKFERKVSWGARCGDSSMMFTHLAQPAMTRLRMKERAVLDTLIESGVARSRADALAWCVRLVGEHEDDWLTELRDALAKVEEVRNKK